MNLIGCLKSPKPSNMPSKLSTNIKYIIHIIFMNFKRICHISSRQLENALLVSFIGIMTLEL